MSGGHKPVQQAIDAVEKVQGCGEEHRHVRTAIPVVPEPAPTPTTLELKIPLSQVVPERYRYGDHN